MIWGASSARHKRRVLCGRTGGGCEFWGLPRVAYFPFFLSLRLLWFWSNIYACWRLRVRIPLCTCDFSIGFWCVGAQVAARAKRRVVCGRNGGNCQFGGLPRVAYFAPVVFDACLRFWFNIYACWRLRVHIPMCTCNFFLGFWCFGERVCTPIFFVACFAVLV